MTGPVTIRRGLADDVPSVLRLWIESEAAESTTDDETTRRILGSAGSSACSVDRLQPARPASVYWEQLHMGVYRFRFGRFTVWAKRAVIPDVT